MLAGTLDLSTSATPLAELPNEAPDARQLIIGRNVARLVPDGAIIQLGIGSMAAAASALSRHRGLRVRSGKVATGCRNW